MCLEPQKSLNQQLVASLRPLSAMKFNSLLLYKPADEAQTVMTGNLPPSAIRFSQDRKKMVCEQHNN